MLLSFLKTLLSRFWPQLKPPAKPLVQQTHLSKQTTQSPQKNLFMSAEQKAKKWLTGLKNINQCMTEQEYQNTSRGLKNTSGPHFFQAHGQKTLYSDPANPWGVGRGNYKSNFRIPITKGENRHSNETKCYPAKHLDTADPKFHDPINGNFSKSKQELKTIDAVKEFIKQYNTLDKNTIFIVHVNNNGNFMGNNYILEVLHALSQNQIKVAEEIVNKQEKFMINPQCVFR